MTQGEGDHEVAVRRGEAWRDDPAPPSELGDVEDAVAEKVGGELTSWMPPGQGEGEPDDAISGGDDAAGRS